MVSKIYLDFHLLHYSSSGEDVVSTVPLCSILGIANHFVGNDANCRGTTHALVSEFHKREPDMKSTLLLVNYFLRWYPALLLSLCAGDEKLSRDGDKDSGSLQ